MSTNEHLLVAQSDHGIHPGPYSLRKIVFGSIAIARRAGR
jgi:hypothetical protein